ncbi:MAG: hypothetical protein MZV64_23830 [Ignavibacteriales bacterium]|nr:hypothetical protein [Ignavibacteriales bacterium]
MATGAEGGIDAETGAARQSLPRDVGHLALERAEMAAAPGPPRSAGQRRARPCPSSSPAWPSTRSAPARGSSAPPSSVSGSRKAQRSARKASAIRFGTS